MSEKILNFNVFDGDLNRWITELVNKYILNNTSRALYFVQLNPHSFEVSLKDEIFYNAVKNADFVFPDGIGIVLASRILSGKIIRRISGYDIFINLSHYLNTYKEQKFSYFFLGSNENTLNKIITKMSYDFPNIKVAGVFAPPFKDEFNYNEIEIMLDRINESKADVLWIGMTAPKQEKWAFLNKDKLNVKLIAPVGAVFDYYVGNVVLAPKWIRNNGFEWLFRFLQEPKRLFYRNFITSPKFLFRVISYKIKSYFT